jgi:hypothetical protein
MEGSEGSESVLSQLGPLFSIEENSFGMKWIRREQKVAERAREFHATSREDTKINT